ncbi:MAG: hypothetical protein ACOCWA_04730, partial [Bacteroidota bacterium]
MRKGSRSYNPGKLIIILSFLFPLYLSAGEQPQPDGNNHHHNQEENPHKAHATEHQEFVPGEFIIDHIKDHHEWHFITTPEGKHISVPLPVILYSKYQGLRIFMSSKLAHGHEHMNFYLAGDGEYKGKIVEK